MGRWDTAAGRHSTALIAAAAAAAVALSACGGETAGAGTSSGDRAGAGQSSDVAAGAGQSSGDAADSGQVRGDGTGKSEGAILTIEFEVTGAVSVSGTTTAGPLSRRGLTTPMSCAEFAEGTALDDGLVVFAVPSILAADVSGTDVLPLVGVSPYDGPGAYHDERVSGVTGDAALTIDDVVYAVSRDDRTTTLVIGADGGGSWTFPHLEVFDDVSGAKGDRVNGTMTWTCQD